MGEPVAILVAARDEEDRIAVTVRALRQAFPDAEVVVADDGSTDGTAGAAERAGARVLRLPRRGKGQALTVAERAAPPGQLLLVDADLRGDLRPLLEVGADLVVAASRRPCRSAIWRFSSELSLFLMNPPLEIPTPSRMPMIRARKTPASEATW